MRQAWHSEASRSRLYLAHLDRARRKMPTNAVPIVVASGALAVSILSLLWQRHIGRHATSLPLVVDLFREYRSRDMVAARRYVRTELAGQYDPQLGLSGLPDEVRPDVLWVSHFF